VDRRLPSPEVRSESDCLFSQETWLEELEPRRGPTKQPIDSRAGKWQEAASWGLLVGRQQGDDERKLGKIGAEEDELGALERERLGPTRVT
jgi:hypothetical protein